MKGKTKYDWITLRQKFFNSDDLEVRAFIRRELSVEIEKNGGVEKATRGWTDEKKEWKRKQMEEAQRKVDNELKEKLKITTNELLTNKKLLFGLDAKFLEILGRLTTKTNPPTKEEMLFFKNYQDKIRDIYQRIQIELGLPIHIEEVQGAKEKPLFLVDLMRQAEEAIKKYSQGRE